MEAKNPKTKAAFNKAISWLKKHNEAVDQQGAAEDAGDTKAIAKYDAKAENTYNRFLEAMDDLPKYEQDRIYKSELY